MPNFGSYNYIVNGIGLLVGILLNIYIGKIVMLLFKKDGTLPRFPVRFAGVYLILNCGYFFYNMLK